jgi:hypothetical protein
MVLVVTLGKVRTCGLSFVVSLAASCLRCDRKIQALYQYTTTLFLHSPLVSHILTKWKGMSSSCIL